MCRIFLPSGESQFETIPMFLLVSIKKFSKKKWSKFWSKNGSKPTSTEPHKPIYSEPPRPQEHAGRVGLVQKPVETGKLAGRSPKTGNFQTA